MSMKFKVGQLVRFRSYVTTKYVPDDGAIGVVTKVSNNAGDPYPYYVTWFLSRSELTRTYSEKELRAVDEEN